MAGKRPMPTHYQFQDLTGLRYGRLTVVEFLGLNSKRQALWLCRCGGTKVVTTSKLKKLSTASCGCLWRDVLAERNKRRATHGMTGTPTYLTWQAMRARCSKPNDPGYANYGGRGIRVCQRWQSAFKNFLEDMGERPDTSHTLERADNDKGYDCGRCEDCQARAAVPNCRWATREEQQGNRRVTLRVVVGGESVLLKDAAKAHGIDYRTVYGRLKKNVPVEQALTMPPAHGRPLGGKRRSPRRRSARPVLLILPP
jgi:hypothetical protein